MTIIQLKTLSLQTFNKMHKNIFKTFAVLLLLSCFACNDFKKLQRSNDLDKKYEMAVKYYEKGDYLKSSILLEELITLYRGTARAEKIYFYYAYTNYELGDYNVAAYQFKVFVKNFPTSVHAEECAYMNAYCYYLNSPHYSLDQTDTYKAINEFQLFVNQYPKSSRVQESNTMIDKLRAKLEKKAYETAKQYYYIGDYQAAVISFRTILKEFPTSEQKDELNFLVLKSNYLLAVNSIEAKKKDRIDQTIDTYLKFVDSFPQSRYISDAQGIYESALKLKEKLKTKST
jgi:outer membrane protein assembly factor BamD